MKARQHTKAKRGSLRSTCSRAAGPPLRLPVSAAPTLRPAAVPCPSLAVSRLRSRPSCVGRASRLPLSLGGPHRTFLPDTLPHSTCVINSKGLALVPLSAWGWGTPFVRLSKPNPPSKTQIRLCPAPSPVPSTLSRPGGVGGVLDPPRFGTRAPREGVSGLWSRPTLTDVAGASRFLQREGHSSLRSLHRLGIAGQGLLRRVDNLMHSSVHTGNGHEETW